MPQQIEWVDEPIWTQNVVLGNAPYVFTALYNPRVQGWFVDIYTADEVPLILGKRLTLGIDLLGNVYSELKPKGSLIVTRVNDTVTEITRDNMGVEVEIVFIGDDETIL